MKIFSTLILVQSLYFGDFIITIIVTIAVAVAVVVAVIIIIG